MSFPDKVVRYDDSVLPVMVKIAQVLRNGDRRATDLFAEVESTGISAFMEAMECLYALRKIEMENGVVHYVA